MSKMIQCDECKKLFYMDSRSEKDAYVKMTAEDPLYGCSAFHLCRKCFDEKFPWLSAEEKGREIEN